jgi:hypothetical protein
MRPGSEAAKKEEPDVALASSARTPRPKPPAYLPEIVLGDFQANGVYALHDHSADRSAIAPFLRTIGGVRPIGTYVFLTKQFTMSGSLAGSFTKQF